MAIDFEKYKMSTGTHWIANSGKDENSGTKGGKAGDQTGHEAELRKWYSRPWTVVLRYPDQRVADTIADLSIAMCLNDNVGYDQGQRGTYWKQLKAANYDPTKILVPCEEDCTAGVSANVKGAGALCGIKALEGLPICTSRNMRKEFTAAGFVALTASKYLNGYEYLLPGDILLYESHHGAANVTCGKKVRDMWFPEDAPVRPDPEPAPEIGPPYVEATGSVNVRKGPSAEYGSMGVLKKGGRARYFGFAYPESGWLLVEYSEATGWISPKYGKVVE